MFDKLDELISKGCTRWQAQREGMGEQAFQRLRRKLRIAAFLKEECEDASYRFWADAKESRNMPEWAWMQMERKFEKFIRQLRHAGRQTPDGTIKLWFKKSELDAFEAEFWSYWEVEKQWLRPRQKNADDIRAFRDLGGEEMLNAAINEKNGLVDFHNWVRNNTVALYINNEYRKSLRNSNVILSGIRNHGAAEPGSRLQEILAAANMENVHIRLSLRQITPGAALAQMFMRTDFNPGRELVWEPVLLDTSEMLPRLVFVFRIMGLMDEVRSRVTKEGEEFDNTVLLSLVRYFLDVRRVLLRREPLMVCNDDAAVDEIARVARALHVRAPTVSIGETTEWVERCVWAMSRPALVPMHELRRMSGRDGRLALSNVAILNAKAWMDEDSWDATQAASWIVKAIEALHGCRTYLAWSDVYSACEQYMRKRGNAILAGKALEHQERAEKAAQNEETAAEISKARRELEEASLVRDSGARPKDEETIRTFLLDESAFLQENARKLAKS
jgi:hypothetical protein